MNRNIMNDLAAQNSSKSEDRSQQARIPAPDIDNIDTNHYVDAKKLTHAPPAYLESGQSTFRLGNPDKEDLNLMPSGEQADAKKFGSNLLVSYIQPTLRDDVDFKEPKEIHMHFNRV